MPVYLQVRQVRDALYREAGFTSGSGQPTTAPMGVLFHNAISSLFSPDQDRNIAATLAAAEHSPEAWRTALRRHIYLGSIGPFLMANQSRLESSNDELLAVWTAVENFCAWMSPLLWKSHQSFRWPTARQDMLSSEESLSSEWREAGWSDSVMLSGVADLVFRIPGAEGRWCVIEYKLGRTSPEADLAQACLYHQMLQEKERADTSSLALVSFSPELHERVFSAASLISAQAKLKNLIGRLAGVLPGSAPAAASQPMPKTQSDPALDELERQMLRTFQEFGAPAERAAEPVPGPSFIRFSVVPARGIRTKTLLSLAAELQIRLKLAAPPLINVSGGLVTIDIEREDKRPVLFSSIRSQLPAAHPLLGSAKLPVGVDLSGQLVLGDLAATKNTHFLVVGTTGSGKSEWLRSAIAGLLLANTPETLQLVLIDPKRNAFDQLIGSRFLHDGKIVYPDEHPVLATFEWLAEETERRFRKLQQTGTDDLRALIHQTGIRTPRIVCVCDEYGDLVRGSDKRTREALELQFTRLGSKARAAGVHLIIATQEARRETIRGSLDANIPARVGLRVLKDIESRLLLQENGAEKLLGNGDLLFKDIGAAIRLQAPLLSKEEREIIFATGVEDKTRAS